jgi:hypothetical protein
MSVARHVGVTSHFLATRTLFLLYGKYIVVDMVAAFERNHFTDCLDGVEPTVFLRFCLECRGSYEVAIARL